MLVLECKNGHRASDPDTVRCPECGEYVKTRRFGPSQQRPITQLTAPAGLLLGGVVLAFVAGLVFMLAAGNNQFGVVVAGLMGFVAATLWMIGCVAVGVRVGLAHDD